MCIERRINVSSYLLEDLDIKCKLYFDNFSRLILFNQSINLETLTNQSIIWTQ